MRREGWVEGGRVNKIRKYIYTHYFDKLLKFNKRINESRTDEYLPSINHGISYFVNQQSLRQPKS